MPAAKNPKSLNISSLVPFCELTAEIDNGSPIDFTGLKTYNLSFWKEGMGFGITDILYEIKPSMQPIVEIIFKDLYGNLAFTVTDSEANSQVTKGGFKGSDLNYASIFDLPYPKFKLTLKGYIGRPIRMELNVRKVSVSLVPSDGSYEIKATFIPNMYGFFADLPYEYLKAVKALRLANADDATKFIDIVIKNYVIAIILLYFKNR